MIFRFGTRGQQLPFLVFAIIDLALAIVVFLAVPYAVWAVLILSVIGIVGLTVTFDKPQRDKTLDRIIWVVDIAIIVLRRLPSLLPAGAGRSCLDISHSLTFGRFPLTSTPIRRA